MTVLMITFIVSGLGLAAISVPLILGKIAPNGLYGFRVRKTMEHPEIWYPVNTYSGKRLLIAGLLIAAAAVGFRFIPGLSLDGYSYAVLAVWLVAFAIAIISSVRYMNSL